MSTLRAIKKTLLVLLDYILPYRHFETRLFKSQLRHEKPVKNSWKVTFTVCERLKFFILWQAEIFFSKLWQFVELMLNVNLYVTLYWFLSILSALFQRKQPFRVCPKNRCSENLGVFFCETLVNELHLFVNLEDEGLLKMNSFTDILQEFSLDFQQRCSRFWNFRTNVSQKNF